MKRLEAHIKSLSMVLNVMVNEGGNEIVGMIITRLQPQEKWNLSILACLLKLVG